MPGLKVNREEVSDGVVYLELDGLLDAHNFEMLESIFDRHFSKDCYRFIIDLKRIQYVSSSGAGVFIGAVGTCQDNDGNIVLVQPSQEVKEIFELLGVYQIFPVVSSRAEALEHFAKKVT
jgi:anti-sigma B factor antagonist